MEVNESLVSTLLSMGFPDEGDIREALRIAKNDVSEAISVLVNDTRPNDNVNNSTAFPCDLSSPSMAVVPMVTSTTMVDGGDAGASPCGGEEMHVDEPAAVAGFPLAALLELEGRTFTEKWSIPFKRHESLCICMQACTRLAKDQALEIDENAMRFVNRALPECFQKLLNSSQVNTWMHDIQEGIFDMLNYLIELIAERLAYQPVCQQLMDLLALALNPQTEYHKRHKAKKNDKNFWKDKLRESLNSERLFSSSSNLNLHRDPYGYLCHLINKFASCRGFERLRNLCIAPDVTVNDLAYALFPFGLCAEQVSTDTFQDYLKTACERALTLCTSLAKDDLKRRDLRVFPLLSGLRLLYLRFREKEVSACDQARTSLVQSMLSSGRFNSRMNGLKELGCMMATAKDPSSAKKRQSIGLEPLLQWMQEKEILSLALGDGHSLDNMQMCDGVKEIVEFIGAKLSVTDVSKLWHMAQSSPALFPVLSAAASRLPEDTLGHLLQLVQADWKAAKGCNDNWAKLVELVGLAAKEKALQILWEMAHEAGLGRQQIDCVLQQHLSLLKDYAKDNLRRQYLTKCVANIKAKQLVYPSVNYLHQLCLSLSNGYKNDAKNTLNEWNQGHELVLVLVTSIKDHQRDCYRQFGRHLCAISSLDGNYTHEEYLRLHLDLIHHILRNADLYLTKIRVLEMWTALISDDSSTEIDRDTFFNWLVRSYDDLEDKTRKELFENHFLQLDIAKVTPNGFSCFKYFFERINQAAGNLTIVQPTSFNSERKLTVEKLELFGSSYLWSLYLRSDRPAVFRAALDCLMDCYYRCVSVRLKAGSAANDLHKRFLNDCFGHLDDAGDKGTGSVLRLLEFYLQTAESDYQHKRLRPLHCATYPGEEMQLRVDCDRPKRAAFQLAVHSHLTFGKLREELAIALNCDSASRVGLAVTVDGNERLLGAVHEWRPLFLLGLRPDPAQPDKPIDAHARLADVKSPSSDACSALERALPSNLLADDSRTYPLLKRCLRQGVSEAAAVLDLLPTCPDPVLADDLTADSPLLTYSLQCLFSMPESADQHAARLVQLAPERLTPRQLYLVGHLVSKAVSACDPQQQRLPDGLPSQLLACAASLRDTREPVGQAACTILLSTLFGLPGFRPADVVSLPGFQSALLDLLVACPSQRVRQTLSQLLLQRVATPDTPELVPALHSLLEGLPLPYWHSSVTGVRQASLHLLCNCAEYFELRSALLLRSASPAQAELARRVASVEQDWLAGFQLSQTAACQCQQEEDALLAGHLRLLAAAWQAEPPDAAAGERLLPQLIGAFLMPADSHCRAGPLSRPAIYDLLLQLCANNCRCLKALSSALRPLHRIHGWEVPAPPEPRSPCGLVGLKNGGATCYMNSVLQQLFMVPGLPAAVLSTPGPSAVAGDEQPTMATAAGSADASGGGESGDGALYQLQLVLAHLLELQQQYYVPDQLWANFSLWGEKVNPREQQDAFAFFQALIDQTDEQAKRPLLSSFFRGRFKHLIDSEQCEHRCEQEEDFYGLHLPVQTGNLEAALHGFVRGETMQADNAYSCERCGNRKVTALRRTRIASLPPVLCIHLKRFDYDWLRGQPLKSDLYFSFPRRVELGPFLASAAATPGGDAASDGQQPMQSDEQQQPSAYNLVGVVIHSGKASAGHYYSLVRERRPGKPDAWFKMNDQTVEQIDLTDQLLESEAFGGTFQSNETFMPEERKRYWSAYMLFYERDSPTSSQQPTAGGTQPLMEEPTSPPPPPMPLHQKHQHQQQPRTPIGKRSGSIGTSWRHQRDSIAELSALVQRGEQRGLFSDAMPAHIAAAVRESNLTFYRQTDLLNEAHFTFIHRLCEAVLERAGPPTAEQQPAAASSSVASAVVAASSPSAASSTGAAAVFTLSASPATQAAPIAAAAAGSATSSNSSELAEQAAGLLVTFLFDVFLRTEKRLRQPAQLGAAWDRLLMRLLSASPPQANAAFLDFFCQAGHLAEHLIVCPMPEQRKTVARLLGESLDLQVRANQIGAPQLQQFVDHLLHQLGTAASHLGQCGAYFQLLCGFVDEHRLRACSVLYSRDAFGRLAEFLFPEQPDSLKPLSAPSYRELAPLYRLLCNLPTYCSFAQQQQQQTLLRLSPSMERWLLSDADRSAALLGQLCAAVCADSAGLLPAMSGLLRHACNANLIASRNMTTALLVQLAQTAVNELRPLLDLMKELFLIRDRLQTERLRLLLYGVEDVGAVLGEGGGGSVGGLLGLISSGAQLDPRRAYRCVKLLVEASGQCPEVRELLLDCPDRWAEAVAGLQDKLEAAAAPTAKSTSNETALSGRGFQRTTSAQATLQLAAGLLGTEQLAAAATHDLSDQIMADRDDEEEQQQQQQQDDADRQRQSNDTRSGTTAGESSQTF